MALVIAKTSRDYHIATVWHPDANGETFDTNHGAVRAKVGKPAYQLTTGQIVEI